MKAKNAHRIFYINFSHDYSSNADIARDNVVSYHSFKISLHEKKTFKVSGNDIASAMSTFGEIINHRFDLQASTTNHIYV